MRVVCDLSEADIQHLQVEQRKRQADILARAALPMVKAIQQHKVRANSDNYISRGLWITGRLEKVHRVTVTGLCTVLLQNCA